MDVIQSCDAVLEGARAAALGGLPHVWFVSSPLEAFATPSQAALDAFRTIIERSADRIIIPSAAVARENFPDAPARKLRVIPWGVALPHAARRSRRQATTPVVAMVGNFYPAKRHDEFVQVAAQIHARRPAVRFAIAGALVGHSVEGRQISAQWRAKTVRAIRRCRLQGCLRIATFTPSERGAWYQGIDLLLCPSREGLSQAMLEAMACGVPVIAADVGGSSELIQHGHSGLLVPFGAPRAMAEAAVHLLDDRALARRLGQGGRRRVLRHFGAARQARRFEQLYREVIVHHGTR